MAKPEVDAVSTFVVSVVVCFDLMAESSSLAVDDASNEDFEGVARSDDKMEALLGLDPLLFIEIQSYRDTSEMTTTQFPETEDTRENMGRVEQ